VCEGTLKTD